MNRNSGSPGNKARQEHASRISWGPHRQASPDVFRRGEALRSPSRSRYRTILVPLDGTPAAEHALPIAISIARRASAELRLVHVHQPWDPGYHAGGIDTFDALHLAHVLHHKLYLCNTAARVARNAPVRVKSVVIDGLNIAERVSNTANRSADLVVMATRPRGRLARALQGSVTASLIRRLDVPLLLVRGDNTAPDLSKDVPIEHVLTALDGSPGAEKILEHASAIADLHEARHTLLRVVEPATSVSGESDDQSAEHLQEEFDIAVDYIDRLMDGCEEHENRMAGQVLASGATVAQSILSYARDHNADLVALAPRRRGRLAQWFLPGLTCDIVRGTDKPVLIHCQQAERDVVAAAGDG